MTLLTRRTLLAAAAATPCLAGAQTAERRFAPQPGDWRRFDLTLDIEVPVSKGTTRLWLPLPDLDTAWQQTDGHRWSGNASQARLVADAGRGTRMLYAEFAPSVERPRISVSSRVQTRNRTVDWSVRSAVKEDPAVLRSALAATELLPLDGIVKTTAQAATKGARTDLEKARGIYQWVVAHAHREPKTRGCGTGDIKSMLESGNLGGKCADLNAIFVGLCRASGVPARDVYGLRVAPSAFGYKELGANSASLKGAQHCRAEVFLAGHGWVAMDPADVLKVMRQETPEWIKDPAHAVAAPVMAGLFGNWEGNWVGYNTAHDLHLPGRAEQGTLPFFMYPQGENAEGRFDDLAPDAFRYTIAATELKA
ncbi:transglutaminase family protein [Ideonella sp. 4Y11]|uniref:Transglutaminase family protein n=1 Tax=Ideonella aquatica TaxID=2824119 RepID=A0A940YPD9_9BURK|nr:transglutaminase family protein [Ideonella aquatica]MBQ0960562.1 transglutaminase family protein [Ideonella aquatica]